MITKDVKCDFCSKDVNHLIDFVGEIMVKKYSKGDDSYLKEQEYSVKASDYETFHACKDCFKNVLGKISTKFCDGEESEYKTDRVNGCDPDTKNKR